MRFRAAVLASARERHSLARLLSLVALVLLVAAVPARAQGTLDQQQSELGRANPAVHSGMSLAQTFTPARSGQLDQVDLRLERSGPPGADLIVEIRDVTAAGAPDTVLASTTVAASSVPTSLSWVSVPISAPSVAGTQYAIALRAPGPTGTYAWNANDFDPYGAGAGYVSFDGGTIWFIQTIFDFGFRTYVAPDTTPPTVTCSARPASLKSNSHKLASITTTVNVTDGGSGAAGYTLVSVQSNQADSGLGPGDLPNDIQGWTTGTADTSGLLRTERYGGDRVYTLTYQGSDAIGNTATCQTTVTVKKGS